MTNGSRQVGDDKSITKIKVDFCLQEAARNILAKHHLRVAGGLPVRPEAHRSAQPVNRPLDQGERNIIRLMG